MRIFRNGLIIPGKYYTRSLFRGFEKQIDSTMKHLQPNSNISDGYDALQTQYLFTDSSKSKSQIM